MSFVQGDWRTVHIGLVRYDGKRDILCGLERSLEGIARLQHREGCSPERVCRLVHDREVDGGIVRKGQHPTLLRVDLVGHVLQRLTGERSRVMAFGLSDPVGLLWPSP